MCAARRHLSRRRLFSTWHHLFRDLDEPPSAWRLWRLGGGLQRRRRSFLAQRPVRNTEIVCIASYVGLLRLSCRLHRVRPFLPHPLSHTEGLLGFRECFSRQDFLDPPTRDDNGIVVRVVRMSTAAADKFGLGRPIVRMSVAASGTLLSITRQCAGEFCPLFEQPHTASIAHPLPKHDWSGARTPCAHSPRTAGSGSLCGGLFSGSSILSCAGPHIVAIFSFAHVPFRSASILRMASASRRHPLCPCLNTASLNSRRAKGMAPTQQIFILPMVARQRHGFLVEFRTSAKSLKVTIVGLFPQYSSVAQNLRRDFV